MSLLAAESTSSMGGVVAINAGTSTAENSNGGSARLLGGASLTAEDGVQNIGGSITVQAGQSSAGVGGSVILVSGASTNNAASGSASLFTASSVRYILHQELELRVHQETYK
jgi:alanine dehydrogenase